MSELIRLLERAASNLSGHPVRVRWRKPARVDAKANTFKHNGVAVIDLHPGYTWDGDSLLEIICHEAAHVADLWHEWSGIPDYASGSVSPPKWVHDLPEVKQIEKTANHLAARWLDYAERNHEKHLKPDYDDFQAKMRTLSKMRRDAR